MEKYILVISLLSLLFFLYKYCRIKSETGFAVYLYWAMFPHKLSVFSILSFDSIIKFVIIFDLFIMLINKRKKISLSKKSIPFILSVLICDLITYVRGNLTGDQFSQLITGLLNILFIYAMIIELRLRITTYNSFKQVVDIFKYNGIILSLSAIVEVIYYKNLRAELGMGNPNYLAFYLAFSMILVSVFSERKESFFVFFIILIGILETGSFSVFIVVLFFYFLRFVYSSVKEKRINKISIGLFIFLSFLIPLIIIVSVSDKMAASSVFGFISQKKDIQRVLIWQNALFRWRDNPIWGVGYNCWRALTSDSLRIEYVTHNDFLRILVDLGLVGIVSFLILWIGAIQTILQSSKSKQFFYVSMLFLLVIFSSFHNNINSILFWFIFDLPYYDRILARGNETISNKPFCLLGGKT